MNQSPQKSRAKLYLGTGLVLMIAGLLAYGPLDEWRYRPAQTFDSKSWNKPDLKYRFSVLGVLIREVIKPGMSEQQITGLLGAPNAVTADNDWQYETQQPGWKFINWTGGGLLIKFDPERHVIEAVDNTLMD